MSIKEEMILNHSFPIPPGTHIRRWMNSEGINIAEFSRMMALSTQSVYSLLDGKQALTSETAYKLEFVTGVKASFWNKLESDYQIALLRKNVEEEKERMVQWIRAFPISDLRKRGVLPKDFARTGILRQRECLLQFFGVANEEAYEKSFNAKLFAARTVRGLESDEPALMAWVQLGRREAGKIVTPEFSIEKFKNVLGSIPRETESLESKETDVTQWLLHLRDLCREAGVVLVFIRPLKGVRHVNGAAHWIGGRPVIQLSLHGKFIDRILFSFCHEAGHILDQHHRLGYVTCEEDADAEREADSTAASILLPGVTDKKILRTNGDVSQLRRLAKRCHVYPGIVFGRYCKRTGYNRNLHLLPAIRKFEWPDNATWQIN
ncbi:MAG: hypothetical protein J5985_04050 [Kiritimatiellae bacterium]|nr:hypothetical protein [Kiritimatiellia bacterium]